MGRPALGNNLFENHDCSVTKEVRTRSAVDGKDRAPLVSVSKIQKIRIASKAQSSSCWGNQDSLATSWHGNNAVVAARWFGGSRVQAI